MSTLRIVPAQRGVNRERRGWMIVDDHGPFNGPYETYREASAALACEEAAAVEAKRQERE